LGSFPNSMVADPVGQSGLSSLFYFAKNICGFTDLSEGTHEPICKVIQAALLRDKKRAGIIIPRDCFKTSIGLAAILWIFTRQAVLYGNRDWRTLVDTGILELSKKHIHWIGSQLKGNTLYRSLYGNFLDVNKGARFSSREIYVSGRTKHKEPNFVASSVKSEVTGLHFDLQWYDDIIGERNHHTPHLRSKAWEHYQASQALLDPQGMVLYTATRWHDGDVTGRLLKRDADEIDKQWTFYIRSIINPDGSAFFPERYPLDKCESMRRNTSVFLWQSQYMNDPVLKDFAIPFKTDTMYKYRSEFPERLRSKTVTVDPAFKDDAYAAGDYAAMIVGGFDQYMNWWGIDVQLGTWNASQFIDKLFELNLRWQPNIFKIERKFTSFLDYAIRLRSRQNGIILPIQWIDRDLRSKENRFQCLEPMFRNHHIYFAQEIDERTKVEMEDELTRCGFSAHDDFLDALADQFAMVNPVMGTEGESPTFPMSMPVATNLSEKLSNEAVRFSMWGTTDDLMEN